MYRILNHHNFIDEIIFLATNCLSQQEVTSQMHAYDCWTLVLPW